MKRLVLGLSVLIIGIGARVVPAAAQEAAPAAQPAADPASDGTDIAGAVSTQSAPEKPGEAAKRTWEDVVVVPRKAFLKAGRLELVPYTGVSLNDVLIRHYAFGGELNYYLSDVFSVGLEGQYYVKERTDRESLVGLQYNRVSTLNRYLWAGSINFGYVPGYGKFTMFNRFIVNWDFYIQAGVGLIQTEIIPRNVGDQAFKNNRIMPNVGAGTHLFLSNWLSFNFAVKDYIFNDLFEPQQRTRGQSIDVVKQNAQSQLVQNVMIYAGLGLYLPTSFQYRTPR
ncbi:MAG TPA: outer membrane beta-barrel domain-containing protein [Polyangia bacterium]